MKKEIYNSLRLGFNSKNAGTIQKSGLGKVVSQLLALPQIAERPETALLGPKNAKALHMLGKMPPQERRKLMMGEFERFIKLQNWWLKRMHSGKNPLQEKMTFFWHNHFVSSFEKVKLCNLLFEQNNLFRNKAFGNYKSLTLEVLYNNAMLDYLDNSKNIASSPNENLSRELLELFTLGIGNYSEVDVQEGARALAGLSSGDLKGAYNPKFEDNTEKTYLGKKGNLKAADMVNAIFEHPKAGDLLVSKLLKFFATDNPDESLVAEYGEFLRKEKFEIKPLLIKIFADERFSESKGYKIKDPLIFLLESLNQLGINLSELPENGVSHYLKLQGLDLFNPPNVKGWEGGRNWLDSQRLVQRTMAIRLLCKGNLPFRNSKPTKLSEERSAKRDAKKNNVLKPKVSWNSQAKNNKEIISELSGRLVFITSETMQQEMEQLLNYDFDPASPSAQEAVLRIMEYLMKTPEYQLI